MAARAVAEKAMPITLVCVAFGISERCCSYQPKLQAENRQAQRSGTSGVSARRVPECGNAE
jgi:hypothetical protein